jgi:hypothetical protein
MEKICHGLTFVMIYIDDLIVSSRSVDEHIDHLQTLIERLNRYTLRINWAKSRIAFVHLHILGHVISGETVSPDMGKIAKLLQLEQPREGAQIEAFLGLANYFRKFIPRYSTVLAPFERLRARSITRGGRCATFFVNRLYYTYGRFPTSLWT